ncbi:MAG: Asp-tRNA(Asn)/Glu-tRNA(Gln) amidotransferase GatCAB subunit A, partial [Candidatus Aenigmatarchaeota archaeon]
MNHSKLSVKDFLEKSKTGEIDLKGFFEKLYEKIQELNRKYNFFITISDFREERTENGKIKGLPVSVKDNICVKGMRCTAGSRILKTYVPVFDATVIKRIRNEGGIITGKTNQDEFGFGTFSTNSGFGVPKNPLDPERTCGGSSGGAAGLTAALNYPHIALGQSTGGSISCPASFCGVVGLTPTYGLVSRYGLIDYANSLDKIGPIGKSVEDVSILLSVISGKDKKDA